MSWDIVLFNSKQKIALVAELDENQLEPTDFSGILESSFDQIKKDDNHREIIGTNFTIEFYRDKEHSSNFMLQLYGENGLYELIELAKKHNWQIYDSGIDGMIDLENPEKNGFENHRKYVEQIHNRK
ncbi:hypothetical protein FPF71_15070 [Algibacter amylolyticus]|uniref:Uncharacterized protein n=1 Tax=Algibacter amylolyticus TaxID=1608400 RepID=A0A5M7AYM3_9FLAO|nr:hypothetical protein [Algibacter amylolyticus]KAA5822463.1 hypothetical protein F2B50_15070 [Algibacter amylolyticus]MBB5269188.1 hypothetical protein [Algibacter amylolyticus]TSJ73613.1 hypothetical protein FPF71_15070 [Algibacter amylolyticus]